MSGLDDTGMTVEVQTNSADLQQGERRAQAAVRGSDLPSSARAAAEARAWLLLAEEADAKGDHEAAVDAARRGIASLLDEYVDPSRPVDDDTAMKIRGADATPVASEQAALLTRGLTSRLQLYEWRFEAHRLRFEPPLETP